MNNQRLCIVGLGLMGGSLAQALKDHAGTIVGVDHHAATRQQALRDGVVDFASENLEAGLEQADALILATPVHAILHTLQELPALRPDGCLVLDIGSTKQAINEAMSALPENFAALGGHPMCGKELAGYRSADPSLFRKKTFVLTRNMRTTSQIEDFALSLINHIGAEPLFLSAQLHDQLVSSVSHLPYVISANLMRYVAGKKDAHLWQISASGFRDVTRLAGSDPQMLRDILLTNRTAILEDLAAYKNELEAFIEILETGDESALINWLSTAQRKHIAYLQEKKQIPPDKLDNVNDHRRG